MHAIILLRNCVSRASWRAYERPQTHIILQYAAEERHQRAAWKTGLRQLIPVL